MDIQFIIGIITIITSMYGMLKFMLKDINNEVEILKEQQYEFKQEMKLIHSRIDALNSRSDALNFRSDALNFRSDALYKILLDKIYGDNIPK